MSSPALTSRMVSSRPAAWLRICVWATLSSTALRSRRPSPLTRWRATRQRRLDGGGGVVGGEVALVGEAAGTADDADDRGRLLGRLTSSLGVQEHVHIQGWIAHDDTPRLLACSDVLLVPSRTATDGDKGTDPGRGDGGVGDRHPVVATSNPGITELIS